ncbi:MAG: chemotaxis protein CheW, partial [Anaerolineales bacterium]|nr:chemotaxis protein CheW [Anaerolineales bacterium]
MLEVETLKEQVDSPAVAAAPTRVDLPTQDKEGKYLTFALGHEEFGLEILKVREINGYMDITAVPQTPMYV